MFFKRPGVLKTKNMMKIFDKFDINDNLKKLLEENQQNAEYCQAVEVFSKKLLDKLSSKSKDIELSYKGYQGNRAVQGEDILKRLNMDVNNDLWLFIISYAIGYKEWEVISAPKSQKNDINKLYVEAKKEKRRLKSLHQKIRDNLRKWESLHKRASALVQQLGRERILGYASSGNEADYPRFESDDTTFKRCAKYTVEYNNLCGEMIDIKENIKKLLKDCGFEDIDINKALKDVQYPKLDMPEPQQAKK